MLRVHRIPFSTNVERVALAAGHKGLDVEWVDHNPADRSAIERLSGQPLVPVAQIDGELVVDSTRIVERLEQLVPEPPLYPTEPRALTGVEVFIEWFNEVWKGPPNALARGDDDPALRSRLAGWQSAFERLLETDDYLLGAFGAADVIAFPFLKYAVAEPDPNDTDPFHAVLRSLEAPCAPPRLDRARGRSPARIAASGEEDAPESERQEPRASTRLPLSCRSPSSLGELIGRTGGRLAIPDLTASPGTVPTLAAGVECSFDQSCASRLRSCCPRAPSSFTQCT